jgi:hypothetical protein
MYHHLDDWLLLEQIYALKDIRSAKVDWCLSKMIHLIYPGYCLYSATINRFRNIAAIVTVVPGQQHGSEIDNP